MPLPPDANEIRLRSLLARGSLPTREILQKIQISQPTLSRLIARLGGEIVAFGRARSIRYALPRPVRGRRESFPVYRIDADGNVRPFAFLHPLYGGEYGWKPADGGPDKIDGHLPWYIRNLRPDGFVGRALAQNWSRELGIPPRLPDWSDDDLLLALSRRGEDCVGDLLVGEESLARYLRQAREAPALIAGADRERIYPLYAEAALAGEIPGSSAGGEQPKFTALIESDGPMPVLVKFSFATTTAEGRRWADLLVCEHLALQTMREAGRRAGQSRILEAAGRVFLEVERFDRRGMFGRLPLVSLGVVDDEFFGRRDNWIAAADRLEARRMLSREDAAALRWQAVFGILIHNTDQHFGNISLIPRENERFVLAPAYDMLPMFYRPAGSEIVPRRYEIPLPPPGAMLAWEDAGKWAAIFWQKASTDARISPDFRQICGENLAAIKALAKGPRLLG